MRSGFLLQIRFQIKSKTDTHGCHDTLRYIFRIKQIVKSLNHKEFNMEPIHFNINNFDQNLVSIYKSVFRKICKLVLSIFCLKKKLP